MIERDLNDGGERKLKFVVFCLAVAHFRSNEFHFPLSPGHATIEMSNSETEDNKLNRNDLGPIVAWPRGNEQQ